MESQFNFKQNDGMKTMIAPLPPSVKKYLGKLKYAKKINETNKTKYNNKSSHSEYHR